MAERDFTRSDVRGLTTVRTEAGRVPTAIVSGDPVVARFPPQRASVSAARRFVVDALVAEGLSGLLDDAQLLVSELATNAVMHAATDFTVSVHILASRVYVEVRDGEPATLELERDPPPPLAQRGHGLRIVGQLAGTWGTRVEEHGKVVWFSVDA